VTKGTVETRLIARTQFVKAAVWCLAPFAIIGITYGYYLDGVWGAIMGFVAACALSLAAAPVILLFPGGAGRIAGGLYGGRTPQWSTRELMQGELKKVIHLRSQRRYDPALAAVNEILQKDPEFTQAALIKARILAEGFDDLDGALMQLKRILAKSPKDDPTYAQARRLYAELSTFKEFGG